jgi:hypothetical protein
MVGQRIMDGRMDGRVGGVGGRADGWRGYRPTFGRGGRPCSEEEAAERENQLEAAIAAEL